MVVIGPDPQRIRRMFHAIARRYDLANAALSFGVHKRWRSKLIALTKPKPGDRILDCATGTGDVAIAFKKTVGTSGEVVGTDFCAEMLVHACQKAVRAKLDIRFEEVDAMSLPYPDDTFDITSIAFGIRNVANPSKVLSEMARVTKPGGVVAVLEFGQPLWPGWKQLFEFYSQNIIPRLGGFITGQRWAYHYLEHSSGKFPCREDFLQLMAQTGKLSDGEYWSLTGGVAYIYIARSVLAHNR